MSLGDRLRRLRDQILNPTASGLLDGQWHPVTSSWVAAAMYDESARVLHVRTKQGKEYPWAHGISKEEARTFFRSWSKGTWIWANFPPGGGGFKQKRRVK